MRYLHQALILDPNEKGNCFPTVIACFFDLKSPEEAIQIHKHYTNPNWPMLLQDWLKERGYKWVELDGHQYDNKPYMVNGLAKRAITNVEFHVCIYKNGELLHDPHISNAGLKTEEFFHRFVKL